MIGWIGPATKRRDPVKPLKLTMLQRLISGDPFWIAHVHRETEAFVVRADEKLTAFLELESAIRASNGHDRAAVPV